MAEHLNLPQQSNAPVDAQGIFSWLWFGYFKSIAEVVAEFITNTVYGRPNLAHPGRIAKVTAGGTIGEADFKDSDVLLGAPALTEEGYLPKVGTAGVLKKSSLKDDGSTVTGTEPLAIDTGATPCPSQLKLTAAGLGALELLSHAADDQQILLDASFQKVAGVPSMVAKDGTTCRIRKSGGVLTIYGASGQAVGTVLAGENGLAVLDLATGLIHFLGDVRTDGVFRVGANQVVGARLTAVTAPAGGGTVVAAPAGGGTIDAQARTAINAIIAAISSTGNTVDPVARAAINDICSKLAAATGHGLTA